MFSTKTDRHLLHVLPLIAALLFSACDDEAIDPNVPRSGKWVGSTVSLFIAPGATKLTATGSTLTDAQGGALALELTVVCNPALTRTFYGRSDVTITGNTFTASTAEWTVTGTFYTPTSVAGAYSVTNGECDTSGTWTASRAS